MPGIVRVNVIISSRKCTKSGTCRVRPSFRTKIPLRSHGFFPTVTVQPPSFPPNFLSNYASVLLPRRPHRHTSHHILLRAPRQRLVSED
ncbi:hypothetical protein EV2_027051 [Malus domestica]